MRDERWMRIDRINKIIFFFTVPCDDIISINRKRETTFIIHSFVYGVNNNKAARKYIVKIEIDDAVMCFTQ